MRKIKNGNLCQVVGGTHKGKSGIAADLHTSKSGAITLTIIQSDGIRFKTLAKNVALIIDKKEMDTRKENHSDKPNPNDTI